MTPYIHIQHTGPAPKKATPGAAGYDLRAVLAEPLRLYPGERARIPTGLSLALPPDACALILPRSGLAYSHGLTVANAPGLIDADYRGEIYAILINHSDEIYQINKGDRIAQLIILPLPIVWWGEVDALPATHRGDGGFGSTGA